MKGQEEILCIIPISGPHGTAEDSFPEIGGRSLPFHTFDAVKSASQITRTIVATDSQWIAQVAKAYGMEVPFMRPHELASRPIEDVLKFSVEWLEREQQYRPEWVVQLQVTHPLRGATMIDDAIQTVLEQGLDSAFMAFEEYHAYWRIDESGRPKVLASYHYFKPKGMAPVYRELRGLFSMTKTSVLKQGSMYGEKLGVIPVRELWALVDTRDEFGVRLAQVVGKAEGFF